MNEQTKQAILTHAAEQYPKECCGLIIVSKGKEKYFACRNLAAGNGQFELDPRDWAKAEELGDIVTVVHSHCDLPPIPSEADRVSCEITGLPWVIVSWPSTQFGQLEPSGYVAPLIGRQFVHGVLDCYALVRDYYKQELKIDLPDFVREDEWWNKNQNLYLDNFEKAGFVKVDSLQPHDGILIQYASPVPNHAAVHLGDNIIMHHVTNRLSCRDVYGGFWRKNTVCFVRHRNFL